MEGKSSTQNAEIERFLRVCQLKMSIMWKCPMFDGSDGKNLLSPHYSKFAVEYDWNNKISQNVNKIGFFSKTDVEKNIHCFQNC